MNELNQERGGETKAPQKSNWLVKTYELEGYFKDIKSNPKNKFLEIQNITSGKENGTTFKILIEKQKYYALFDRGAEISVIIAVAFEQLDLFDKLYDSNIPV